MECTTTVASMRACLRGSYAVRIVASRQNPLVRTYRDLAHEADAAGVRLLLDGAHLVREAHAATLRFESVVIASSRLASDNEERSLAESLERPVFSKAPAALLPPPPLR